MVENITEKPTSSKLSEASSDDIKHAEKLMSDGKKYLIKDQPHAALELFVKLCEVQASIYGETGDECAEAYLYYGKTLLEIARMENTVLGHAISEAPVLGEPDDEDKKTDSDNEEITNSKKEEIRADVENALREGNLYNEASNTEDESCQDTKDHTDDLKDTKEEKEKECKESGETSESSITESKDGDQSATLNNEAAKKDIADSKETTKSAEEPTSSTKETDDADAENAEDTNEEEEDVEEDDVPNMQLAWEMFELTCLICNRQITEGTSNDIKEIKTRLAEAKYGLAQVSLESENYEVAIKDFEACLELYEEILEDKNDRRIAEVQYNIGLSKSFDKQYSDAIDWFKKAVVILEQRIKSLGDKIKNAEEKGNKDSPDLEEWTKELNELNDLIVLDMKAKIEDAEQMKAEMDKAKEQLKDATKEIFAAIGTSNGFDEGFDSGFDAPGFDAPTQTSDSSEVVHDITSKVRSSKRKQEDEEVVPITVKKVKKETGEEKTLNGHVNGHSNGGASKELKEEASAV